MKRRQRRNPFPILPLLGVGAVAAVGAVAFAMTRKHPVQVLPTGVQFDPNLPGLPGAGIDDPNFAGLIATDFLTADVKRLGFQVPGVHDGDVLFQAVANPNVGARTILAISRDERFADTTPRELPQSALTGASPAT